MGLSQWIFPNSDLSKPGGHNCRRNQIHEVNDEPVPEDLHTLRAGEPVLPGVLFVFAAPDVTYGEMMAFVRPVQGTHGTIYVFLDEAPAPAAKAP